MAYKPWYVQAAEIHNQQERDEFVKGVFGFRSENHYPILASLIAGSGIAYAVGATRAAKKAKKKK